MRDIVVQYVADCPNLSVVLDRLKGAGAEEATIALYEVRLEGPTPDGFAGSPTVLIDGINPIGPTEAEGSVSCTLRIPSVKELRTAFAG